MAQDPAVATDRGTFTPPTDQHPGTPIPPAVDQPAGMPPVEDALRDAKEAMMTMSNLSDTWGGALERIKWVMDTVSPVAEVRYDVLSPILG
jgi:hypothetical protein